jgi:hypothetical protein
MTWTLIPMPAAEELAFGYVPSPREDTSPGSEFSFRRLLVMLFAFLGLVIGIQHAVTSPDEAGHRRVAETNLGERKGPCRDCARIILDSEHSNARIQRS